jgi:phosphoacetylglucosamine mutase
MSEPVSVGVVQTAYANGASRDYIVAPVASGAGGAGGLGLPAVALAKTGVKYVHHAAARFDVGIYFEANGHGTVLFHARFVARLVTALEAGAGDGEGAAPRALRRLFWSTVLVNQAIGDALSDAMFVEAALALQGWDVRAWDAMYDDLPSVQAKLVVPDRKLVRVSADETRVLEPPALQAAIDALVAAAPRGRAFVRPSGTEDVVRTYAEAADAASARRLSEEVLAATKRILC